MANSIDPEEMANSESPHLDPECLQMFKLWHTGLIGFTSQLRQHLNLQVWNYRLLMNFKWLTGVKLNLFIPKCTGSTLKLQHGMHNGSRLQNVILFTLLQRTLL